MNTFYNEVQPYLLSSVDDFINPDKILLNRYSFMTWYDRVVGFNFNTYSPFGYKKLRDQADYIYGYNESNQMIPFNYNEYTEINNYKKYKINNAYYLWADNLYVPPYILNTMVLNSNKNANYPSLFTNRNNRLNLYDRLFYNISNHKYNTKIRKNIGGNKSTPYYYAINRVFNIDIAGMTDENMRSLSNSINEDYLHLVRYIVDLVGEALGHKYYIIERERPPFMSEKVTEMDKYNSFTKLDEDGNPVLLNDKTDTIYYNRKNMLDLDINTIRDDIQKKQLSQYEIAYTDEFDRMSINDRMTLLTVLGPNLEYGIDATYYYTDTAKRIAHSAVEKTKTNLKEIDTHSEEIFNLAKNRLNQITGGEEGTE